MRARSDGPGPMWRRRRRNSNAFPIALPFIDTHDPHCRHGFQHYSHVSSFSRLCLLASFVLLLGFTTCTLAEPTSSSPYGTLLDEAEGLVTQAERISSSSSGKTNGHMLRFRERLSVKSSRKTPTEPQFSTAMVLSDASDARKHALQSNTEKLMDKRKARFFPPLFRISCP
jgi:hypothetical protein